MILAVAEVRDGQIGRATWEIIAAAQACAGDNPVAVAVLGERTEALAQSIAEADVTEVLGVEDPSLAAYTPEAYTTALASVVSSRAPALVLLPHTYRTRDFAPRLAARLRKPLISDVVAIDGSGAGATFSRPMFQGKLVAQVRATGTPPVLVSVQAGVFPADAVRRGGAARVERVQASIDPGSVRQQPEPPFQEARQAVDLSQAERIVSVGRGIKSQDKLPLVEELARVLGAELAASRPICDNGWLPMERQIGSSGQTVAPRLYLAIGISGAIQHLVGMKGSRTIVAVNKDPDAPIFEVADYGIIGDLFEIVPALTAALKESKH